jgi:hypothetical protein
LPVPDLGGLGSVEPPQADLVAGFWAALLQLDSKWIAYNHSKDPQLIGLNMPHLVELFATNGIQIVISTEVTNALKRCTERQLLGAESGGQHHSQNHDQMLGIQETGSNPSSMTNAALTV